MTTPPPPPPPDPHGQWQPGGWQQPGPPPPPPRRTPWLKIVLSIVAVLVLLGLLVAGCTVFVVKKAVDASRPLFDAGNNYLSALNADRLGDAGLLRCDASEVAAAADADRLDGAGWTGAVNLNSVASGTGGDTVSGSISTSTGTRPVTIDLSPRGTDAYCVVSLRFGASQSGF